MPNPHLLRLRFEALSFPMAYYKITVKLRNKKSITGIRELDKSDVDYAWRYFQGKIIKEYSRYEVISFEVVMVSKLSEEVKNYLKKPKRPASK